MKKLQFGISVILIVGWTFKSVFFYNGLGKDISRFVTSGFFTRHTDPTTEEDYGQNIEERVFFSFFSWEKQTKQKFPHVAWIGFHPSIWISWEASWIELFFPCSPTWHTCSRLVRIPNTLSCDWDQLWNVLHHVSLTKPAALFKLTGSDIYFLFFRKACASFCSRLMSSFPLSSESGGA